MGKSNSRQSASHCNQRDAEVLRADNYPRGGVTVTMHIVNEPDEVRQVKALAIAQTVRTVLERKLLLKLNGTINDKYQEGTQ